MNKPTCPRCDSKWLERRVRTQDCVCQKCGLHMPNPWNKPAEYKAFVKSMTPPPLKVVYHYDMGDGQEEQIEYEGIHQP